MKLIRLINLLLIPTSIISISAPASLTDRAASPTLAITINQVAPMPDEESGKQVGRHVSFAPDTVDNEGKARPQSMHRELFKTFSETLDHTDMYAPEQEYVEDTSCPARCCNCMAQHPIKSLLLFSVTMTGVIAAMVMSL